MYAIIIKKAIEVLAGLLFGHDANGISVFDRIVGVVERWGEAVMPGSEKRHAAMEEIATLENVEPMSESLTRLGVELAVRLLKL